MIDGRREGGGLTARERIEMKVKETLKWAKSPVRFTKIEMWWLTAIWLVSGKRPLHLCILILT